MNAKSCENCRNGSKNNSTGEFCNIPDCGAWEKWEPVEKTYRLWELEKGKVYVCDCPTLKAIYDGFSYRTQQIGTNDWVQISFNKNWVEQTFTEIKKKKLTFEDLEVGASYKNGKNDMEFIGFYNGMAVSGNGDMIFSNTESGIRDWSRNE